MAYKYAIAKEVAQANKWCLDVIHQVQKEIKNFFTFDIRLIGSGEKNLVTQNGNQPFDLDYNLILQRDKQNIINDPKRIKNLFRECFDRVLLNYLDGYNKFHASDSTSVITIKEISNNQLVFSFDVAIIIEGNDGFFYRLTNDKNSGHYIWNQVKSSRNYFERYQMVKDNNQTIQFKKEYLELKNYHLRNQDDVKSFSIFLETLNGFYR